jgi:hypothetical protein
MHGANAAYYIDTDAQIKNQTITENEFAPDCFILIDIVSPTGS